MAGWMAGWIGSTGWIGKLASEWLRWLGGGWVGPNGWMR